MRAGALALSIGVLAASCRAPAPSSRPPEPTTTPGEPRAVDPELVAIADTIDPGPQPPLIAAFPPELMGPLRASLGAPDQAVAVSEVREALMAWEKGTEDMTQRLLKLGRGLILAERAVAAGSTDAELLLALDRVYALLEMPVFGPQGTFQQVLQAAAQAAQAGGLAPGAIDPQKLVPVLKDMFSRAGALHLRTAAELLRRHGDHPEVPRVLGRLVNVVMERGEYAEGLRLRQLAMRRLGERATPADRVELARTCYRALDLACGDAAQAQARALRGADDREARAHAQRLADLARQGERAHRAVGLQGATDVTAGVERGHLLLLLEREVEAEAVYTDLRARHPKDARPVAGLAKLAIHRSGDFGGASRLIGEARGLEHMDQDFYEVALGSVGIAFLYEIVPQLAARSGQPEAAGLALLKDMRGYADGLRRFDPARAAVVELIVRSIADVLPDVVREDRRSLRRALHALPAAAAELARSFPDSPDVLRLRLVASGFAADAESALAIARAPLPAALAGDPALARARLRAWFDATLLWERADQLPALTAAIEALPLDLADHERATLLAAVLSDRFQRTGDRSAAERAAALYGEQAQRGSAEERAVALNNAAVNHAVLGELQQALELFRQALQHNPSAYPAALNMAAMVLNVEGAQRPELVDVFARVAQDGDDATLRLHAHAWRHLQAERGAGDVEETRTAFVAGRERERAAELRGTTPPGRWGIYNNGSFEVSFYYSVARGLEIRNGISTELWLFFPSPNLDALLEVANKSVKPKKRGRAAARSGEDRR